MKGSREYPRGPLKTALKIANVVDGMGGKCSMVHGAEKMLKKVNQEFYTIVGVAEDYGLLVNMNNVLITTRLYQDLKFSYNEEDRKRALMVIFLRPRLFKKIYHRYTGEKLPVEILDKILIREYGIGDRIASTVAKYFITGARMIKLLDTDDHFIVPAEKTPDGQDPGTKEVDEAPIMAENNTDILSEDEGPDDMNGSGSIDEFEEKEAGVGVYNIRIKGPDIDLDLEITDMDDLALINAILGKVEKRLGLLMDDEEFNDLLSKLEKDLLIEENE
ncbi:MAG: hypothetical protein U9R75_12800 [Candidatus Thermoplasmatota archaeon]|nr:hypothetical protein [Candidatus Thermoplasmatota archaeon]